MSQNIKNFSQAERRQQIIQKLKLDGNVRVSDLSELLSTSEVTIRSDLAELENSGILQRVHGGAVQTVRNYYALNASERLEERKNEKLQMAEIVANLVRDGDNIIINSGSTCYYIALELRQKKNLRIITHSIQVSEIFAEDQDIEVILLGGLLNYQYMFTHGDDTMHQLNKYQVDKAILSADGIDFDNGITTYHHEVADLCNRMLMRASLAIVAADNSKIGHTAFSQVSDLEAIDYLVTDKQLKQKDLRQFEKLGIEVLASEQNKQPINNKAEF
ncbi:MAG: DeoR/GlpR family DNA-binding transcription regulator [Saccharofermentanales bacterium]|jgi:DeoR/GlpR family transcriptional regulator of sugar metabolism